MPEKPWIFRLETAKPLKLTADLKIGILVTDNSKDRAFVLPCFSEFRYFFDAMRHPSAADTVPSRMVLTVSPYSAPAADLRKIITMRHGHRTKDAFTLIEMIVVILIIATLTALFVGAAANTFDRARRALAKNDVTQIVTAVNAFYTEYGRYPVTVTDPTKDAFFGAGATSAGSISYSNNDVLFNVLRNITTDPNAVALNPRQIVFLSPGGAKSTTPPRGGISQNVGSVGQYFDPWGSQYAVLIDTNYDNTLTNPYSDLDGSAGTVPLRVGAVAYSFGKNGQLGGGAALSSSFTAESGSVGQFKGSSDVYSW
jgi:prepilin-type N-terminal cleavage/methylation domain-containing protein